MLCRHGATSMSGKFDIPPSPKSQTHVISVAGGGEDRLGWLYIVEIADCTREAMERRQKMIEEACEQGQEMAKSIDTALFGLYSMSM